MNAIKNKSSAADARNGVSYQPQIN